MSSNPYSLNSGGLLVSPFLVLSIQTNTSIKGGLIIMLFLLISGAVQEIEALQISEVVSYNTDSTQLRLKDDRILIVDETEENVRKILKKELRDINMREPKVTLHQYYSNIEAGYYPIAIPLSAIKSVARGYYTYHNMRITGKLAQELPAEALETSERHQPAIVYLQYPVKDGRGNMLEEITVYESAKYVMSFLVTVNQKA